MVCSVQYADTLTPERKQILELHQSGKTVREIALYTGLSTQRVYQQLGKLGIDKRRPRRVI